MPIQPEVKIRRVTKTTTNISLTGSDILQMMIDLGYLSNDAFAEIRFRVPGGGDWSGMSVDVDGDNPVTVTVETTEEEGE